MIASLLHYVLPFNLHLDWDQPPLGRQARSAETRDRLMRLALLEWPAHRYLTPFAAIR